MRKQERSLPILLLSLALAAPAVFAAAAPAEAIVKSSQPYTQYPQNDDRYYDDGTNVRFEEMDTNGDGRVTRSEWRGNDRSFDVHDWNRDGVLSGDELRPGNRRDRDDDRDWTDRFDRLDRNNDGSISRSEWPRDRETFDLLDRNNDGRLSQSELTDRTSRRALWDQRFTEMDTNRDGRLSQREWPRNDSAFERLDQNNDGYVSRSEFLNRDFDGNSGNGLYPRDESRFHHLDRNRDRVLSRAEWTGSRNDFDRLDRDRNGYINLNEWLGQD